MPANDEAMQLAIDLTEMKTTISHMSEDVREMKNDVKDLREAAPLHRISNLENRWKALVTWLGLLTLSLIGVGITWLVNR